MSAYARYCAAIRGERLPLAFVDMDALDDNIASLIADVTPSGKTLRLATKSVRCPELIDYIVDNGGAIMRGLMAFAVSEAAFLADRGHTDILVAYPTMQETDAALLAKLNQRDGVEVSIVVDSDVQLDFLSGRDTEIPVVIEADMSLRKLGGRVHMGVRRSPLHSAQAVLAIARSIRSRAGLRFAGVMGYEAQVAGVGEANPFSRVANPIKAAMKRASIPAVRKLRSEVADALTSDGFHIDLFNGGGTGSLATTCAEAVVTEVTAGSGFLCSHLFDYYPDLALTPAAMFALQVVRVPGPGHVTCHGGGLVASGEAGRDRLPRPVLPRDLRLTGLEGAGEVQTPLVGAGTRTLAPGDPVFFRHAKAGELAEHFNEYVRVRGDRIEGRAKTYRGHGQAFL